MLKLYLWLILVIVIVVLNLGWTLPYFISAPNTELVIVGLGVAILLPVVLFYIINKKIKPIVKEMIEKVTKGEI